MESKPLYDKQIILDHITYAAKQLPNATDLLELSKAHDSLEACIDLYYKLKNTENNLIYICKREEMAPLGVLRVNL